MSGKVLMAVYGTLRPGHYNHDRFPGGVTNIIHDVRIPGALYVAGLPFLNAFDPDRTVVADVLEYDAGSMAYFDVCHMEIGARYVPVTTTATTATGRSMEVLAWHYPGYARGELVEDGDFNNYREHRRPSWIESDDDDDEDDDWELDDESTDFIFDGE